MGTFTTTRACGECFGSGEVPNENCASCRGIGVLRKNEEISIKIPAGIEHGEMIRMSGQGEAIPHGIPGDLYVKVHVEKHPVFKKEGSNLNMELAIKLTDALLGNDYFIKTLDGEIKVSVPAGIAYGETLRVKGKGVPTGSNKRGDLLIKILIKTPEKLSKKAAELVEKLKEEGV